MSTHEARALYSALLDGELSPEEHSSWQTRLGDDTELAADYAGFAASVGALRGLRPQALSEERVAALMAPLEAQEPAAPGTPWPQLLAGLAAAAAIWWLVILNGFAGLLPEQRRVEQVLPAQLAGSTSAEEAHREESRQAPVHDAQLVMPAVIADSSPVLSSEPAPLGALSVSSGQPRLRASAGVHLVRGESSTRLSLRGEVGAVIPELLALLDTDDPALTQLATTRLALLQIDLAQRGLLPEELSLDPLAQVSEPRRSALNWFESPPDPPTPSEAWNAWWTLAREHLPRAQDSEVL